MQLVGVSACGPLTLSCAENINKRHDRKRVVLFLNVFQCISLIVSPRHMLLDTRLIVEKNIAKKFW